MSQYFLAQLNMSKLKAPIDSPLLADFVGNLDRINALAEQSPGFVWRLKDESGSATSLRPFGEEYIVNMSVWKDVAALSDYAFKSGHVEIMRRRREWFERLIEATVVLWWVPRDHRPTTAEAKVRLELLRKDGPSPQAFTFKNAYLPPDAITNGNEPVGENSWDDTCPAT